MIKFRPALPSLLLYLAAVLVALSFGFSYGNVGNQETYLPHALNRLDPSFLRYDWLVQQTDVYHPHFGWIIKLAAAFGSVGWVTAILNVLAVSLTLYVYYRIAGTINAVAAVPAFLILLLFVLIDRTDTVAGSALFSNGLQPSALATMGWAFTTWFFIKRQFAWSGLALAAAGLFHTNFLLLGIGLFGFAHLLLGRDRLGARLAWQIIPSVIALIPAIPLILDSAGGEGANVARHIFQHIRSPHHYVPSTYLFNFLQWTGWMLAGGAASAFIEQAEMRRMVRVLLASMFLCVVGATLLTTAVFIAPISQLYVWRIAPFAMVLSQLLVALFLVQWATGQVKREASPGYLPSALVVTGMFLVVLWLLRFDHPLSHKMLGLLAIIVTCLGLGWRARFSARSATTIVAVTAAVLAASYLPAKLTKAYTASTLLSNPDGKLYAWVRSTPPTAVFLIPPEMGQFRIRGERAVVVDWKSTPIRPAQLIAWRERMEAVVGAPFRNVDEAQASFRKRSLEQLRHTGAQFSASYIIVDAARHEGARQEQPLFEADGYQVYAAAPALQASTARP